MSSYVFMKVLESTPERYDRGVRWLSGGRIGEIYDRVAATAGARAGARILDVGTGTGGVALACARRGAAVVGIDANPDMLAVARRKAADEGLAGRVELVELGAMEIEDRFAPGTFDGAASCLVFSELTDDEQRYVLRTLATRLLPGAAVAIADETEPAGALARFAYRLRRLPQRIATYLIAQTTTRPVAGLDDKLRDAGFEAVATERLAGGTFSLVTGRVKGGAS